MTHPTPSSASAPTSTPLASSSSQSPPTRLTTLSHAERAKEFFTKLDLNHMNLVAEFYDAQVVFQDPIHQVRGVEKMRDYYAHLYKSAQAIRFEYQQALESEQTVTLVWKMFLTTASLNSGREFAVEGVSVITFGGSEGKAIRHRDYFDLGAFIYEQVPVLGSLIRYIKGKLGN